MDYTDSEQGQYDLLADEHSEQEALKAAIGNIEATKQRILKYIDEAIEKMPYEVWHPDGQGRPPRFQTWDEAVAKQTEWNKDCPGHVARKRK